MTNHERYTHVMEAMRQNIAQYQRALDAREADREFDRIMAMWVRNRSPFEGATPWQRKPRPRPHQIPPRGL